MVHTIHMNLKISIYIYIFPGNSAVKNLLVNAGGARYTSLIPGSGR